MNRGKCGAVVVMSIAHGQNSVLLGQWEKRKVKGGYVFFFGNEAHHRNREGRLSWSAYRHTHKATWLCGECFSGSGNPVVFAVRCLCSIEHLAIWHLRSQHQQSVAARRGSCFCDLFKPFWNHCSKDGQEKESWLLNRFPKDKQRQRGGKGWFIFCDMHKVHY
jgi:hypothetical protein